MRGKEVLSGEAERCNYEIDCRGKKKLALGVMGSHVLTIGISATTFQPGGGGGAGKPILQGDWLSEEMHASDAWHIY